MRNFPPMRRRLGWILVATFGLAGSPVSGLAQTQPKTVGGSVARVFGVIHQSFVALAEAMPEEHYGFRPSDGEFSNVRTFSEQVKHVACSNFAFFDEIEGKEPPAHCESGGPSSAQSKAELLAYLRDSFDYGERVIRETTEANSLDAAGGPYGGASTRLGIETLAVWHASDHYGQLVVYLRLNGIVPPASRGD